MSPILPYPDRLIDRFRPGLDLARGVLAQLGGDHVERIAPEQLRKLIAEHAAEAWVRVEDHAVLVNQDAIHRRFSETAEALLALAYGFLGAPSLGHVAEAPDPPDAATADALRSRCALENSSVEHLEHVEALGLVVGAQLANFRQKRLGVLELPCRVAEGEAV